ncbi:MAG: pyruvate carboxylase subunit B [Deltaproteobacteria bacterium]|nr:pyruvate carboxylase subunit B [Deltaproteobacteria bacterium]MBU47666.1 pyruvate carboxylase subunit B [Deltaproteobacteria bacterium]|tara:strand:+ start:28054 stop:29616 length:1563 start_codon:yes stop_codon:yes gene_type:complete
MASDLLSTHGSFPDGNTPAQPTRIVETALRDAHQSLLATRMRTADMLPILEKLDQIGYWSVEMWGGATFDSCLRFLKEDPWDRLRLIRKHMPNTRLQMLMRGQNIVGYKHYPDDIVRHFVKRSAECGIDVFRIFDALNDTRNMKTAIDAVLDAGKIAEGAISYTTSPFHTVERFVALGKELEAMGCQILCIKDMAGLLTPYAARSLVSQLNETLSIPIHVHSHGTSSMSESSYLMSIESGAQIIDTAISSLSGGTSQPPTESIVAMLQGTPHATGLDLGKLAEIADYFREVRKKYAHLESPYNNVDPQVLRFQIPGGMISNLANQLREQDALDRMTEVLEEVPRVREDMGFPPLVTPTSQIVGTQATLNVIMGERYRTLSVESRNLLLGKYGRCPAQPDKELQQKAAEMEGQPPIEGRPADALSPMWEDAKAAVAELGGAYPEEDALCHAIFPQVAKQFFESRARGSVSPETMAAAIGLLLQHLRKEHGVEEKHAKNGTKQQANPWKMAARLEGLRIRSF